jgi:hypothetical protein
VRLTSRLYWALRSPRSVRLHLSDPTGRVLDPSVAGLLMGVWGGFYVLQGPKYLESEDRTLPMEGVLQVPSDRVLFVQVLDR